ncbi:MAG: thiol-disulfide isomerase [Acidobacteria bacterium]|nr:MAG: thiol-disulfide isomerase [Acidobacteriota bacterium]
MRTGLIVLVGTLVGASPLAASDTPTFYKDIAPILQANCQTCHRPGEIAPMSLLGYEDARPWARAIKAAVLERKMPPWFADPRYGHFANERRLTSREVETISAWVDGGAPAGKESDAPPPRTFENGWNLSPDIIVEMPKAFELPASGTINYKYVLVKTNFKDDLWVTAAEMRPGNSKVLHHGKVWVRPAGSTWMSKAVPGEAYERESHREIMGNNMIEEGNDILGKFNPGLGAQQFDMGAAAKLIPKGSDLVFELHYTTSGEPTTDVSKLGLVLAKEAPRTRYFFHAGPTAMNLAIPAGHNNAEVVSEITFGEDASLVYAQPHMHLRGKDFELRIVSPTKETTTVLKGVWNFDWQMGYQYAEPIPLPKGSKLQLISHFDNSPGNRFNPDPATKVLWGPQNWDEMSNCFIGVLFPVATAPDKVFLRSGPSLLTRGEEGPTLESLARVDPNAVGKASNASTGGKSEP